MVYNGFWFAPEREMLQAAIDQTQAVVNGEVRLKFYKGKVKTHNKYINRQNQSTTGKL
jgi:argininosuccinate synthase